MPPTDPIGDVVVVIPGIAGSVLARNGKEVWSPRPGAALRAVFSRGSSIKDLALRGDDPAATDLGDGVVATRLVPDLHVLPGIGWKIDGYGRLRDELVGRLGLEPGRNYFELPYDWRRDNRVAAAALAERSARWLADRRAGGHPDAQLVLIGHSMGGIVARIFLELLDGWRDTRSLITFGTPFAGSVNALEFLANGFRKEWGPVTVDLSDTLRSFTSVYQLLPSYRCMTVPGDPAYVDEVGDIPGLDGGRAADALALQRTIRARVDANRATDYEGTGGYGIRPVIGDFQLTRSSAKVVSGGVEVSLLRHGADERGDGTVPKVSAIPHEFLADWLNASYRKEKHASLQNDDAVIDQVCGAVTAAEMDTRNVFPAAPTPVLVQVDDALIGEAVAVTVQPRDAGLAVTAAVEHLGTGASSAVELDHDPDTPGGLRGSLDGLPSGDYRLAIGGRGINPTVDFFTVIDPDDDPDG